jgi:hypothetical protein
MTEKEALVEYRDARIIKEDLDIQFKEAQAVLDKKESQLVNLLLDKEARRTADYEGIGSVTLMEPKLHASYTKEYEPQVFEMVRDKEPEIIKETIHWSSFSKFISGLIEEGKEVPKFVSYYFKQGIRFNKA